MNLDAIVCMDALDFLKTLPDACVDAVIIDPPYATTQNAWDVPQDWQSLFTEFKRIAKPRAAIAVFCNNRLFAQLVTLHSKFFRYEIVIEKSNPSGFLNANRRPLTCHEFVAVFGRKAPCYYPQMIEGVAHDRGRPTGGKSSNYGNYTTVPHATETTYYPRSVWRATKPPEGNVNLSFKPNRRDIHPTEKDVDLISKLVMTFSLTGETVLDCFMGSGATALAARNAGRHFIGCDLNPDYVKLANERLANSDPFQPTTFEDGSKQLSLFEKLAESAGGL